MDVPFSNKFLMPCCVGCSTDDDYDDFGPKFFLAFKMAFWCQKVKKSQKVKFSMESQYIFAHFCQKSLIQKSGFRLPKHWWNLIGKWGVSFPGRVGGCSVQFEILLYIYKLHLRFCSVARRPPASEEVGRVARFQPPTKMVVAQFRIFRGTAGTFLAPF